MKGKYSRSVLKAIDLIWTSFNREEMRQGYMMLVEAARKGDADALCFIARCHMGEEYVWSGAGFDEDDKNASLLMQKSALMGSASGVLCAVRSGNFTPAVEQGMPFASFKEAYEEILEQAKRGNAFCQYMIGNVYFWEDYYLVEPDLVEKYKTREEYHAFAYPIARQFYEASFKGRLSMGFGNYRTMFKEGYVDRETYEKYFQHLANISPCVCSSFGTYLEDTYKNYEEAASYAIKAVQMGDARSAYNAGTYYDRGKGVEQDFDMAFRFYEIAAMAGEAKAQWQVGYFYFEAWGSVKRDYAKAVQWFRKAFEQSDGECDEWAAAYLAVCCQNGLGTVQDDEEAFDFLCYIEDVDELWDDLAAKVLNAYGVAYAYGRGAEKDIQLGIEYFDDAIARGSKEAKKHRKHFRQDDNEEWYYVEKKAK